MTKPITVRLFAGLASSAGATSREFEVPDVLGSTPRSILRAQTISESAVAFVLVNGLKSDLDAELHEGDRVAFVAPAGGG